MQRNAEKRIGMKSAGDVWDLDSVQMEYRFFDHFLTGKICINTKENGNISNYEQTCHLKMALRLTLKQGIENKSFETERIIQMSRDRE